jgi:hypothetical protein
MSDPGGPESATMPADVGVEIEDEVDEAELDDIEDPDGLAADLAADDDEDDGSDPRQGAMALAVLDYLAKAIVDDPDSVEIEVDDSRRRGIELRLHVAQGDMGKVIGRRGRVAQALRTVVRAAGAREGVDVQVDIVD